MLGHRSAVPAPTFLEDVIRGLRLRRKALPCKYLYDEAGAELFEKITELPEYYPTRSELEILARHSREIAEAIGEKAVLLELGSGSLRKTRLILDALKKCAAYIPFDIAAEQLEAMSCSLRADYPAIPVLPQAGDFSRELPAAPGGQAAHDRRFVFFPGSTVGNLAPEQVLDLFIRLRAWIGGKEGGVVVGVDLQKKARTLIAAYDDSAGITAQFNLNLLKRINRELGADFDLSSFRHQAIYNFQRQRVEMHLKSLRRQKASVGGWSIFFEEKETIHTENSYKYTVDGFQGIVKKAGFSVRHAWLDSQRNFSVHSFSALP